MRGPVALPSLGFLLFSCELLAARSCSSEQEDGACNSSPSSGSSAAAWSLLQLEAQRSPRWQAPSAGEHQDGEAVDADTVVALVATGEYAGFEIVHAALTTLGDIGGFRGHVLLATDMPACAINNLFRTKEQERLFLLRSSAEGAASMDVELPRLYCSFPSDSLGYTLHIVQVPRGEVLDAKLAKTHVWDFARLAGLQPKQIVYQDVDIFTGASLDPFFEFISGNANATPGYREGPYTTAEVRIVDQLFKGQDGLQVPHAGSAMGRVEDFDIVHVATAAEAASASVLLFGSYYGGHNPRHGALIVSRAGAGESCLVQWREKILSMKAEDPEVWEDEPALGFLDCDFAYLPWQFMHFPTLKTLEANRTEVFMHFAVSSILSSAEEKEAKKAVNEFCANQLNLKLSPLGIFGAYNCGTGVLVPEEDTFQDLKQRLVGGIGADSSDEE